MITSTKLINGQTVEWRLEHCLRLKRIHIHIHPQEGVIVCAPAGLEAKHVSKVLRSNSDWLLTALDDMAYKCPRRNYFDGEKLPFLGGEAVLRLQPLTGGQPTVNWTNDVITLGFPEKLKGESREVVRKCLSKAYLRKAKEWIPKRVAELNGRFFNYKIHKISIKEQSRILGSCSTLGNLNFNWRLMLAPIEVVDYVIIHELAHFEEMNHSKRFWAIVAKIYPDYKRHRAWLKEHCSSLYI